MGKYLIIVIRVSYSKLHSSIVCSSLWTQPDPVRILFVTLLAIADREGYVYGSRFGIARIANIKTEQIEGAFSALLSPDPFSCDLIRSPENEGRRLEEVSGGFLILNYPYYRGLRDDDERREQNKQAQKRFREKKSQGTESVSQNNPTSAEVSQSQPTSANVSQRQKKVSPAEAEAEAEAEEQKQPPRGKTNSPSAQKENPVEPDSYMAAKAYGELAGFNGNHNLYIAKQAMETYRRRKPEVPMQDIPQAVLNLWREYDGMAVHGKVSMKTFLGELGRFMDSNSWRQKPKETVAVKPQNGFKAASPTPQWAFTKEK